MTDSPQILLAHHLKGRRPTSTALSDVWYFAKRVTLTLALRSSSDAGRGEAFLAWCDQMLARTLRPGDVVIMDNLSAHKVAGVRETIEQRGAQLLYLPPYSPDFNPIENAFVKLKALVRKAAARTIQTLEAAVANALPEFEPGECANFFAHAGYGLD